MCKTQRLFANESLQSLDAKGKFTAREGSLYTNISREQAFKIFWNKVFETVNDAKAFCTPALYGWLFNTSLGPDPRPCVDSFRPA
jgi:hypothetical protein